MPGHADKYTPFWLEASQPTEENEVVSINFKAYAYASGACHWSLKQLFMSMFGQRNCRIDVTKELRRQCLHIEVLCMQLGLDWEEQVLTSYRQIRAIGEQADMSYAKLEPTITTAGLILLLILWANNRRSHIDRRRAVAILELFCLKCFAGDGDIAELVSKCLDGAASACSEGSTGGFCHHLARSVASLRQGGGGGLARRLVACMVLVSEHYLHCRAACIGVRACVDTLCRRIGERIEALGFSSNPLKHGASLDHRGRRHRIDEDFKRALVTEILTKRKGHSKASIACIDGIREGSCRDWDHAEIMGYIQSCWRQVGQAGGVYSLQLDAARLGQPARETVVHILQNNGGNVACYLPPQALPTKCEVSGFSRSESFVLWSSDSLKCNRSCGAMPWPASLAYRNNIVKNSPFPIIALQWFVFVVICGIL